MNRIRLVAIVSTLLFGLTTVAQQTTNKPGAQSLQVQLKLFTEKLDLSGDQQAKTKAILQELNSTTQRIMQDESISTDERQENVKAWHHKADRKLREILSDGQKKKLDELEQEPHPELHGR